MAGVSDLAVKAIDIMRKKANERQLANYETPAEIAAESIREVRSHFSKLNEGQITNAADWERLFIENNFVLMLGYFFEKKPYLFTIDMNWCLPIPVKHAYKAIGIGDNYGEVLLREFCQADPHFEFGYVAAAAVVEKVIDNIEGCGRPTWMGYAFPTPQVNLDADRKLEEAFKANGGKPDRKFFKSQCVLVAKEEMEDLTQELKMAEKKENASRIRRSTNIFRNLWQKRNRRIKAETKKVEKEMKRRGMEIPPP
jgi:hypothetical protein